MSNNNQWGTMPMSQGAATYKAMSKQTEYFLELMKQKEQAAITYAETYGNVKDGVVAQYIKESQSAANDAGSAIRMDAFKSLVGAAVGVGAIGLTAVAHFATSTAKLDDQIENLQGVKNQLDAPPKFNLGIGDAADDPNAPELGERTQAMTDKLNDLATKGPEQFDSLQQTKLEGLKGKELQDAQEHNAFNEKVIEHAKSPGFRKRISDNLNERLGNLKTDRNQLINKFQTIINMVNPGAQAITSLGQMPTEFAKSKNTSDSQMEQSVAQVLQSVQSKQSSFIDTAQQEASSFAQSADAIATGYAQIVQVHG